MSVYVLNKCFHLVRLDNVWLGSDRQSLSDCRLETFVVKKQ